MTGWSIDSWRGFWAKPDPETALRRIPTITAPEVEAVWPRSRHPVRGPKAYAGRVVDLLSLVPDMRLELKEHAASGDLHFIRWQARGTGPDGAFEGIGCDRIALRGGLVVSNLVMSDMAIFERLEAMQDRRQSKPRLE